MRYVPSIERDEGLVGLPVISDNLSKYITPTQILENVSNYPEMQRQLNDTDRVIIERVKAAMLQLPLVYSTRRDKYQIMSSGILPFSKKPADFIGNSMLLDDSLGLTDYTFYNWGIAERSTGHGTNHALLSASLLFDPRTIVTEDDVARYVFSNDPYSELDEEKKDVLQKQYLGKMLAGRDWVEVMARRVYFALQCGNIRVLNMSGDCAFGEIKIYGAMPPSEVKSFLLPRDERDYWTWQIRNGFLPGPVGRSLVSGGSPYDPKPDELGVTLEEMVTFWNKIFTV